MDIKELFGSESKTQVYAHLHELIQKPAMEAIGMFPLFLLYESALVTLHYFS